MDAFRLLPKPPPTQARASQTFSLPPLDGSMTLPELLEWHSTNSPNHRLFVLSNEDGEIRTIYWPEAVRAICHGAKLVRSVMRCQPGLHEPTVVGVIANSDTVTYFTLLMSIIRAGYVVFPISPRNSAAAVAHLMSKVGAKYLFIGREQAEIDLSEEALKIMNDQNYDTPRPEAFPAPRFEDFFVASDQDIDSAPDAIQKRGPDDTLIYLHSSGSTAFPKPIPWTNHRVIQLALIPYFGDHDLTDVVFSLHTVPMYHGLGVVKTFWAAACGTVISAFGPRYPPQITTAQDHFHAAVASQTDIIFCVPRVIEDWSRRPDFVKWLATRIGVLFGGGPLDKATGDYLTSQGVSVFLLYGATESGVISPIISANKFDLDWEYFRFPANVRAEMVPYANGAYELISVSSPFLLPSIINTTVNGVDAYATSDLFVEHPQKPGYWKVYGRKDDQIMHSTGEKTNPGPLENIINQDPHVQAAVIFGRGQFQAGILIEPKAVFKFDPSDEAKLIEFRNHIWPTIQRMNQYAPQHSRLFKEMIMVSKPSKPFQYTAKNTARRQAIINDYCEEIAALYANIADSIQSDIPFPKERDWASVFDFVRAVVNSVLKHSVKDDEDIFQHGCDSLQATWIRNSLLRALRDTVEIDTRNLVDNFVYVNPTILSMTSFLCNAAAGATYQSTTGMTSRVAAMHSMVAKYTSEDFFAHDGPTSDSRLDSQGHTILLTGSTGALGSYVLAELVDNPAISQIYAVNRPRLSDRPLRARQEEALLDRDLQIGSVLGSDKVVLLEGDLCAPFFGMAPDTYEKIRSSVTHIIHIAWPVDFNLSLASFEKNVQGVRNLVDFALSSSLEHPPYFVYTSSIGVAQNVDIQGPCYHDEPLPEQPVVAEMAVGTGYSESKWVSEEILLQASRKSNLNAIIVRVGQLSGGVNGAWNTSEWLPALVQSGKICGCLPSDERTVDWIPLHVAAKVLVELRITGKPSSNTIIHLIHPRPVSWSSLASFVAEELNVPLVPFDVWFGKLEETGRKKDSDLGDVESLHKVPAALRLLQFFRSMSAKTKESGGALGFWLLSCDTALQSSSTLSDPTLPRLDQSHTRNWMKYWRKAGFI